MNAPRVYQGLFTASIVGNAIVGVWCVADPAGFAALVWLAWAGPMTGWARAWGATLLGLHAVYWPGLRDPLGQRWINWSSIAIKFFMPIIFVTNGPSFYPFAAWDAAWGLVLLAAYWWLLRKGKQS